MTDSELHGNHHTLVAEFWIVVGMMALIIMGDAVAVSAVAVPAVIAAWWIYRGIGHRVERQHAPVQISWHGPRGA